MERRYLIKLNLERLETQNQNVPMDRAERVDEKNRAHLSSSYHVYSLRVMAIKVSKMTHFLYFLPVTVKKYSQFEQNI